MQLPLAEKERQKKTEAVRARVGRSLSSTRLSLETACFHLSEMVGPGAVLTHYAFGNQKSCYLKRLPPAKFTELLNGKSEKNNCLDFDKCINSQEKKV